MTGSRRQIEKILFDLFCDDETEYNGTSFHRNTILTIVEKEFPKIDWKNDIYSIIRNWQKSYDKLYEGIYNEKKLLLECGVTDNREICERKYQNGLSLFISKKKVPLYFDRDIKQWRVPKSLSTYEEIIGDKIIHHHTQRNLNVQKLAKRGGRLLSGVESRKIIYDFYEENKKLENKSENK